MPPPSQPVDVRKLCDVLREYQKRKPAQHGSTRNNLKQLRNYKYDMERKVSRYFKRPQLFYYGVPRPTGIQPINLLSKSIGWSLYDKGLHHENIKIIWNSAVFQMFSNVYRLL